MAWSKPNARKWMLLGALLVLWAAVSATRVVDPIILPTPWSVVRAVPVMFRERLLSDIGLTLGRVLSALVSN